METFYVKVIDNNIASQPMSESEIIKQYGNVDNTFKLYVAESIPTLSPFEVIDNKTVEIVDDVAKDIWHVRPMTDEEKQKKIADLEASIPPSWTVDMTTGAFISPHPYPTDGRLYNWNENTKMWIELVVPADVSVGYRWDTLTASWIEISS